MQRLKNICAIIQLIDKSVSEIIRVHQLGNRTSGIAADYFVDDHKEDALYIARYIARSRLLPLVHLVGERIQNSNVAFIGAGRLIEVFVVSLGMMQSPIVQRF